MNKSNLPKLTQAEVEALIDYIDQTVYGDEDEAEYCCTSDALDGALSSVARALRSLVNEQA